MRPQLYDLLVIGGGINGTGVAADAAGRGLSVLLVEMGDLAGGTSQASSKLIHGGLRYLEHYEFRLVREALAEREVMLDRAPHIVWPLRFILPAAPDMRSSLKLRAGLFLYDHLSVRRRIPRSSSALDLRAEKAGSALRDEYSRAYAYWDCWVDDSRLVILNARLAASRGAEVRTRTRVVSLARGENCWTASLEAAGGCETCAARVVVNAAGPWADRVASLSRDNSQPVTAKLRLVKGSHIVVPRIKGADDAFLLQNSDGRIIFLLPFEGAFTLIGTTDIPFSGSPSDVVCSPEEESYLLSAANRYLAQQLHPSDIAWRFSGVRPLQADESESNPSALSRDYELELSGRHHGEALLTIIGGKVTTYRRLAEAVMTRLQPLFPGLPPAWTASTPLPGGDIKDGDLETFIEGLSRLYAWLPETTLRTLAHRHGSAIRNVIGDARRIEDMGRDFGFGLTEREVRHFAANEWARTPADVLWRRTKTGLHLGLKARSDEIEASIASML